jgi:hypothetical protein
VGKRQVGDRVRFFFSGTVTPLAQYLLILPVLAHFLSCFLIIFLLLNYYGKILNMLKCIIKMCYRAGHYVVCGC